MDTGGVSAPALVGSIASCGVAVGGSLAGGGSARLWGWEVPGAAVQAEADLVPALMLFFGSMVVLVRAWLALRRHVRARVRNPGVIVVVAVLWAVPLLVGPPLASRDVYSYAAAGEVAEAGLDPYAVGPSELGDHPAVYAVDPLWSDNPSPYGPLFVRMSAAISRTGSDLSDIVFGFRAVAVAGLALLGVGVARLARQLGRDPADALALVVANPLTLLHLVSGAHNEALMLGLLALGLAWGRYGLGHGAERPPVDDADIVRVDEAANARRWRVAGLVLCTLAAAVKAPALLGVIYLGWAGPPPGATIARRIRATVATVAGAAGVTAVVSAVTGYGMGWVRGLRGSVDVDAYLSLSALGGRLAGLAAGATDLVDAAAVGDVVRIFGLVAGVAAGAVLLWTSPRRGPRALAAALLILGLALPTTQPWYPLWGLVVLAPAVAGDRARGYVALSAVFAFAAMPSGPRLGMALADVPLHVVVAGLLALVPLTVPLHWLRASPPTEPRSPGLVEPATAG